MIVEPSNADAEILRCQACIIGAGAAGIALALELGRAKLDVVLVAGGGYEQSPGDRALYQGTIDPIGSHEPLEQERHRAFGGSTKRWGGRLVPYDRIDFERRDFVPLSGWPIEYEEVARYFPRSMELCEVVRNESSMAVSTHEPDVPATLGGGAIETTRCERWSMPTDFGVRYRKELKALPNVRVLIDYHAVDLRLDVDLQDISEVKLKSRFGRPLTVSADMFVLATGGIENARLLLASREQLATGVGNHSDMVGRCYMSHLAGTYGYLCLKQPKKPPFYRWHRDAQGAYCRRRFWLSERAQRELAVMNVIGFPYRPDHDDASHRDAVLSLTSLSERIARGEFKDRTSWGPMTRHLRNLVFTHPGAWLSAVRQIRQRMARPRLPFIMPFNPRAQDVLFFQSEHAPDLESRLQLSDERDEFGMPRITPRVKFSQIDFETVMQFYRTLDESLRQDGVGHLEYDVAGLPLYLESLAINFWSMAHQLGTTRMSADPRFGVVDPDCKVHSVGNLYVSGGSVFPTSGHANPTLTILALTLRLADHLKKRFVPAVIGHGLALAEVIHTTI
jgi:choline dehydrogenase-like flavoprotein